MILDAAQVTIGVAVGIAAVVVPAAILAVALERLWIRRLRWWWRRRRPTRSAR